MLYFHWNNRERAEVVVEAVYPMGIERFLALLVSCLQDDVDDIDAVRYPLPVEGIVEQWQEFALVGHLIALGPVPVDAVDLRFIRVGESKQAFDIRVEIVIVPAAHVGRVGDVEIDDDASLPFHRGDVFVAQRDLVHSCFLSCSMTVLAAATSLKSRM